MIFSWQSKHWDSLQRLKQEQRLPHALLFTGPQGIGKTLFAKTVANFILCTSSLATQAACGVCHACHLIAANSHPDLRLVQPEEEGNAIKIDQVRELSEFVQKTAHQSGYRVVILQPADAMNTFAANALLKTLEEPTPGTLLILVTTERSELPATIVSRCQQWSFALPETGEAERYLQTQDPSVDWKPILEAAGGAPLKALQWQQAGLYAQYQQFFRDLGALSERRVEPLALASQWKDTQLLWLFDLFFQWLLRLMRAELNAEQSLPSSISLLNLLEFSDYLKEVRAEALGSFNLNQQLLLEALFIRWSQYATR